VWAVLVSFLLTISPVAADVATVLDHYHGVDDEVGLPLSGIETVDITADNMELIESGATVIGNIPVSYSVPDYIELGIKITVTQPRRFMFEVLAGAVSGTGVGIDVYRLTDGVPYPVGVSKYIDTITSSPTYHRFSVEVSMYAGTYYVMFNAGDSISWKTNLYQTAANGYPLVVRSQSNQWSENSQYGLAVKVYELTQSIKIAQTFTLTEETDVFFADVLMAGNTPDLPEYGNDPGVYYDAYVFPVVEGVPSVTNPLVYIEPGADNVNQRAMILNDEVATVAESRSNTWYNNGAGIGAFGVTLPAGTYALYYEFIQYYYYDDDFGLYRPDDVMVNVPYTTVDAYTGGALFVATQETWSSNFEWHEIEDGDLYFRIWTNTESTAEPPPTYTSTYYPTATNTATNSPTVSNPGISLPTININVDWDNEGVHWLILIVGIAIVAVLFKGDGANDKRPLMGTAIVVVMLGAAAITGFINVWFIVLTAVGVGLVVYKFLRGKHGRYENRYSSI
jgi:hypothetical protein